MKLVSVCLSHRPAIRPLRVRRCGPGGGQEISIDCCTAGVRGGRMRAVPRCAGKLIWQFSILYLVAHLVAISMENKKLSYHRVTARCVLSVVILPITTQQCRNYLYSKS